MTSVEIKNVEQVIGNALGAKAINDQALFLANQKAAREGIVKENVEGWAVYTELAPRLDKIISFLRQCRDTCEAINKLIDGHGVVTLKHLALAAGGMKLDHLLDSQKVEQDREETPSQSKPEVHGTRHGAPSPPDDSNLSDTDGLMECPLSNEKAICEQCLHSKPHEKSCTCSVICDIEPDTEPCGPCEPIAKPEPPETKVKISSRDVCSERLQAALSCYLNTCEATRHEIIIDAWDYLSQARYRLNDFRNSNDQLRRNECEILSNLLVMEPDFSESFENDVWEILNDKINQVAIEFGRSNT
jgi:hypothetical protein